MIRGSRFDTIELEEAAVLRENASIIAPVLALQANGRAWNNSTGEIEYGADNTSRLWFGC